VDYATRGLHDEEIYWHIYVFGEKWPFLFGFVLQEDLIFEGELSPNLGDGKGQAAA